MNVPDKDWSNNTVKDDPQYGVLVNQKFLNIVDDHGHTQLVSLSTRQASVLDLVIASHPDLVGNLTSSDGISGINDHSAVSFELNLTVKVSKKKLRTVYKFTKANLEDIHHDSEILSMNFSKIEEAQRISASRITGSLSSQDCCEFSIVESQGKRSAHGMISHGLLGISRNY